MTNMTDRVRPITPDMLQELFDASALARQQDAYAQADPVLKRMMQDFLRDFPRQEKLLEESAAFFNTMLTTARIHRNFTQAMLDEDFDKAQEIVDKFRDLCATGVINPYIKVNKPEGV